MLEIERTLLEMYADPALDHKPELLEKRGGAYYSEAAAALVTSLLTGDGAHHYVDVRNNATIAGLPDEAVVEVPAHVDRERRASCSCSAARAGALGLVQAVTSYEVLAIEAARTGSRSVALRALLANPAGAPVGPCRRGAGRATRGESRLSAGLQRRVAQPVAPSERQ